MTGRRTPIIRAQVLMEMRPSSRVQRKKIEGMTDAQ